MHTAHWYLAVEAGGALPEPDTCPKAPTLTLDNAVAQDAGRLWRKAAGRMLAMHGMPLLRMHIIALLQPSRPAPLRSTAAVLPPTQL